MSDQGKKTGGCLCGAVRFEVEEPVTDFGACHCSMCRKWAGGPSLATHNSPNVTFTGEENLERYQSSDWAERGFCKVCGSNLFYHLKPDGEYFMMAGAFDDDSGLEMVSQVFIDEKPDGYAFANETRNMTGAEIFALFGEDGGDDAQS